MTGLCLAAVGTGAQAVAAFSEYKAILRTLSDEVTDALATPFVLPAAVDELGDAITGILMAGASLFAKPGAPPLSLERPPRTLMSRVRNAWLTTRLLPLFLALAVAAGPRKLLLLWKEGGDTGRKAVRFAQTSTLWTVIMAGSLLGLCAALIQLVSD